MGSNNFKLTLDTLAPNSCTLSPTTQQFVQKTIEATYSDPGDSASPTGTGHASFIKTWHDTKSSTDANTAYTQWKAWADAGKTGTCPYPELEAAPWVTFTSTKTFTLPQADGLYYIHAVFADDVGNLSSIKTSGIITSDTVAPTISGFATDTDSGSHDFINDKTFTITITAQDTGTTQSGLDYIVITHSDLVGSPITIPQSSFTNNKYVYTATFKDSTAEGLKDIKIIAYDKSGNASAVAPGSSLNPQPYYDPGVHQATLQIKKDASTDMPTWVNAANNSFIGIINTGIDTDIVAYQIYGDITINGSTSSSDTWYDWPTAGATSATISNLAWTTSPEGTKDITIRVKDQAGNISEPFAISDVYGYDNTAPATTFTQTGAVTNSANNSLWIAAGNGAINSATINYTCDAAVSGLTSLVFECNGTEITGVADGSFVFSSNTPGAIVGANTLTMIATDNAGNAATKTLVINIEDAFNLTSAVLSGYALHSAYYKKDSNSEFLNTIADLVDTVTMSAPPSSGAKNVTLKAWINTISDSTTAPSSASPINWGNSGTTYALVRNDIYGTPATSNTNYVHVEATSLVGNKAYLHTVFSYDESAPTFTAALPSNNYVTNQPSVIIAINNVSDGALANTDAWRLTSSSSLTQGATTGWETWTGTSLNRTVTLAGTEASGDKTVTIDIRDKAGNYTTHTVTWEYDKDAPQGSLVIKKPDGTTNKESPTSEQEFKAVITYTADTSDAYADIMYQISGDIATSASGTAITYDPTGGTWVPMTAASITTESFYLTRNTATADPEGVDKTITVHLKDNAGNITELTSVVIKLNQQAAVLEIDNISHNRISCEYVLRRVDSSGTVSPVDNDYASIMSFRVTSNQDIIQWKVAAFKARDAADHAYPSENTNGSAITAMTKVTGSHSSTGYSATIPESTTDKKHWTVEVDGLDYRNALGGSASVNVDGTYWVVVFAQNKAGVWSIAGTPVA